PAPPPDAAAACTTCSPAIGLCAPLPVCSASAPCTGLLGQQVTTELDVPKCRTTAAGRPMFDDGPPLVWNDALTGDSRAACGFVPPGASASTPVPLLGFLHGSHGGADDVYDFTSLRSKAQAQAFALVSLQGRNLHWQGPNPDGAHHDYFYRDLASPSMNPD